MCFAPQRRALFRHLNVKKWSEHVVSLPFWLGNVLRATTACTFPTSELPKVVREFCAWYIFTYKCASCHNGVHFFDSATSKSAPNVRFLLLTNVLRATTTCTFSTSQLPKVARTWSVFTFFTYKCASRHNGVQFFISHLASWLRTRRFSEVTFRPSGPPEPQIIIGKKHSELRLSYLFAHLHLLSSDLLPLWSSPSLIFSSLTLRTSAFPSLHLVGSLSSKLPSIIHSSGFSQ